MGLWENFKESATNVINKPINYINPLTLGTADFATGVMKPKPKPISSGISGAGLQQAGDKGLELGQLLTGQTLQDSGNQFQDLLKRQMGLVSGNNPITSEMTGQRNAAVARTGAEMAKAGIRGGAANAAKRQTAMAMDKQIASQAYQQYQDSINKATGMVAGAQRQGLAPRYAEMGMATAASQPTFQGTAGNGVLSGLFGSLFG